MKAAEIRSQICELPSAELVLGYGSDIFRQGSDVKQDDQLTDLLVLVGNREQYLDELFRRRIITRTASYFSKALNPEVSFFADVSIAPRASHFKLGVAESSKAIQRLKDWDNSFYLPGRLQKPTLMISSASDDIAESFEAAQKRNLSAALRAAALALPPEKLSDFSLYDLYSSLVGLSYLGDIRVGVAENPKKTHNIVVAQQDLFHRMYEPFFEPVGIARRPDGRYKLTSSVHSLFESLPYGFQRSSVHVTDPRTRLVSTLSKINRRESLYQAMAGPLTSGPGVSTRYLFRKLFKRFK